MGLDFLATFFSGSMSLLPIFADQVLHAGAKGYGAATIVFGFSRSFALTLIALAGTGFADAISTVIRQTLRQLLTPDRLRGRMTSVNMIFFMGGSQLGELEAGLVASLFASVAVGVTVSVASGGAATVLLTAVIAALSKDLRRYDFRRHTEFVPQFPVKEPAPGRTGAPIES